MPCLIDNDSYWHTTAFAAMHHLGRDWTTTDKRQFWPGDSYDVDDQDTTALPETDLAIPKPTKYFSLSSYFGTRPFTALARAL